MNKLLSGIVSMGILLAVAPAALAQKPGAAEQKNPSPASATAGKSSEKNAQSAPGDADKGKEKFSTSRCAVGNHPGASDQDGALDVSESAEVRKLAEQLKRAGVSPEDVKSFARDETADRRAAKNKPTSAPSVGTGKSGTAPAPQTSGPSKGADQSGHGMGPYVQMLLAQGLHGQALADAIHAEQARRHNGNGHGAGPDAEHGHGKGAVGHPGGAQGNGGTPNDKSPGSSQAKTHGPKDAVAGAHGKRKGGDCDDSDRGKGGKGSAHEHHRP